MFHNKLNACYFVSWVVLAIIMISFGPHDEAGAFGMFALVSFLYWKFEATKNTDYAFYGFLATIMTIAATSCVFIGYWSLHKFLFMAFFGYMLVVNTLYLIKFAKALSERGNDNV